MPSAAPDQKISTTSRTILVVDDDPDVCDLIHRMLGRRGYLVLTATNGEDALRICQDHPGPIDLLLSDVVMPGMNGSQLARRVRELRPRTRLLFISGVVRQSGIPGGLPTDAGFLAKPFTWNALLQTLGDTLPQPESN
jgi:two-component system cell cycle sensor histidine kinase/response regulator CckA